LPGEFIAPAAVVYRFWPEGAWGDGGREERASSRPKNFCSIHFLEPEEGEEALGRFDIAHDDGDVIEVLTIPFLSGVRRSIKPGFPRCSPN
jgi:hypothetical protein